jgi:hypothetical protein
VTKIVIVTSPKVIFDIVSITGGAEDISNEYQYREGE